MVAYRLRPIQISAWSCTLRENCILDMPRLERSSQNSNKSETITEDKVIVKGVAGLVPDHCHHPQRPVVPRVAPQMARE